jgi:hypothetical protein
MQKQAGRGVSSHGPHGSPSQLAGLTSTLREWGYEADESYLFIGESRGRSAPVQERGWVSVRFACGEDVWRSRQRSREELTRIVNASFPLVLADSWLLRLVSMLCGKPAAAIEFSPKASWEPVAVLRSIDFDWELRQASIDRECRWREMVDIVTVHIDREGVKLTPWRKNHALRGAQLEAFWNALPQSPMLDLLRMVYCETRGVLDGFVDVAVPELDWSDGFGARSQENAPDSVRVGFRSRV